MIVGAYLSHMVEATEWSPSDVEYLVQNYWDMTYKEIADGLGMSKSVVHRKAKEGLKLPKKTEWNRIEHNHGVPMERVLHHLHCDAKLSVNRMSDLLDVSRITLDRWFSQTGVPKRGQSEAEKVKWEQASEEDRQSQTKKARETYFEKYGDGGYIQQWIKNNPEEHRRQASKAAALGAPARERNGMAGVTGQDHPGWRGGKSIYDAVKKQLRPSFGLIKDGYRADRCYMCAESDCKLDVHHIVPIMVGGTNEKWNLMTLCESCHHKVEWYTRSITEPLLVE